MGEKEEQSDNPTESLVTALTNWFEVKSGGMATAHRDCMGREIHGCNGCYDSPCVGHGRSKNDVGVCVMEVKLRCNVAVTMVAWSRHGFHTCDIKEDAVLYRDHHFTCHDP